MHPRVLIQALYAAQPAAWRRADNLTQTPKAHCVRHHHAQTQWLTRTSSCSSLAACQVRQLSDIIMLRPSGIPSAQAIRHHHAQE
eukprot:1156043-Pelagomonas_calceolata.AAC.18